MTETAETLSTLAWIAGKSPGVENLETGSMPRPVAQAGELLIQVEAAALNFSDLLMIDDAYQVRPPRPFIPGQEIAGTVVEADQGTGPHVGDRVAGKVLWGGFSEYAALRADMAIPVPGSMSAIEAVALPVSYTTAMVALTECTSLAKDETLLVHAAGGGVGLAAVQVGRALGARVLATAGSAEKCAVAVDNGAAQAFNYRDDDWADQVRAAAGDGVDVVFDPVGGDLAISSLKCLAYRGRYLVVGFASGDVPQIPAHRLLLNRLSAIGVYWDHDRDGDMLRRVTAQMLELCTAGHLRPLIGGTYPFGDLPRALEDLRNRSSVGKLVLEAPAAG